MMRRSLAIACLLAASAWRCGWALQKAPIQDFTSDASRAAYATFFEGCHAEGCGCGVPPGVPRPSQLQPLDLSLPLRPGHRGVQCVYSVFWRICVADLAPASALHLAAQGSHVIEAASVGSQSVSAVQSC